MLEMIKIRQNLKFPSQSQSRCRTEEISPGVGCAEVIDVAKKNCPSKKLPNLPKKFVLSTSSRGTPFLVRVFQGTPSQGLCR